MTGYGKTSLPIFQKCTGFVNKFFIHMCIHTCLYQLSINRYKYLDYIHGH